MAIKKSDLYSSVWASCNEPHGHMDAELSALEARRTKTRALMQANMEALLTAAIRPA